MSRLIDKIMKIYEVVQQWTFLSTDGTLSAFSGRNRLISLRDLLRFCSRIQRLSNDESQVVFLDAVDCFVAHMSDTSMRFNLSCQIAGELNMTTEKVAYCLNRRPVGVQVDPNEGLVHLGRASLSCQRTLDWESGLSSSSVNRILDTTWPFASTRLACTLLERIAVAVAHHEPVLLVGETGTGKTTAVQRLAQLCGRQLHVINLNQQSDSVDLMGGFKPVDTRALIRPLREQFESLFCHTFRTDTNLSFLGHINTYFNDNRWRDLLLLMRHPTQLAIARLRKAPTTRGAADDSVCSTSNLHGWTVLLQQLDQVQLRLDASVKANQPALGFAFIEGALVRAIQNGDWVLLDEVNLAAPEMLNCLSGLLDSGVGSVTLIERGNIALTKTTVNCTNLFFQRDKEPLPRNSNFHLFAAMNPSTDVGKRELPVGLRNRFTEIYVPELNPGVVTDADDRTLRIDSKSSNAIRSEVESSDREDLCILTRSYLVALSPSPVQVTTVVRLYAALRHAAVEGLVDGVGQRPHFSFGSQIGRASRPILDTLIRRYLALAMDRSAGQSQALDQLLASPLPAPPAPGSGGPQLGGSSTHVNVEGYWIPRGPQEPRVPEIGSLCDGSYILTSTVRDNLRDLARVLDDNRTLFIPETQETIKAHPHFRLFATQNPPGLYAGRKASGDSRLFEWVDGPLVTAMSNGEMFLLDEISLADDAVLERLNSLLEPERRIHLTERSELTDTRNTLAGNDLVAHPKFRFVATMNPGGDYGKKELSPALRNRFTEIWCMAPTLTSPAEQTQFRPNDTLSDLIAIVRHNLLIDVLPRTKDVPSSVLDQLATVMVEFVRWYALEQVQSQSSLIGLANRRPPPTIRDLIAWVGFIKSVLPVPDDRCSIDLDAPKLNVFSACLHGAALVFLDALESSIDEVEGSNRLAETSPTVTFSFDTPTSSVNLRRLLRALQLPQRALLLEGSPGVGKTTLVLALAQATGHPVVRINLSEATEASDLLGADLPVEGTGPGIFAWRDGPLLQALRQGHWIILDEVYLQPLSVHDQQFILSRLFPTLDAQVIRVMIQFNAEVAQLWNNVCSSSGANHMVYYQPVGHVQLVDRTLLCGLATNTNRLVVPDASRSSQDLILLDALRGSMESLLTVLEAGWMAILVGPAGCGKRFLAHVCATLMGRHLSTVCLSPNSDTVELLGSLEQHENGDLALLILHSSPSVLDRLNSLLEPGGELIINERGLDIDGQLVRLKPHPQFRLILTVDEAVSHTGSYVSGVSRAMRNRGVEIAFCKELSTTEPDLIRILIAAGAPLSIARAITAFHRELRSMCDPNQLARSSNAPVGLRRLPPIGSLISAAIYAQQLLTETDRLTNDSTTEGVVRELFPDGQESQDIAQLIPSVQNHSLWFAALARSLNWLYAGSQVNGDAIKFVKSAIREFLNSPLSAKFASLQATDIVPSNYHTVLPLLTQQLEDVFACSDAGQYRRRYVHCLVMSYVAQPRNDELVAARALRSSCRILLEQANPVPDLSTWLAEIPSGCDDDLRVAGANLLHESTRFQQNTEFAIPDWLDWPDQRWIPGWWWCWRPSSNTQELDWDRKLRLLSANELLCQSHANGSAELSSQDVVSDMIILSELPILSASRMLFRGDLPATWAELYPGLREVTSHWLRGMHSFVTLDFVSDTGHARCDLSAVDRALYAVHHAGLLWSWLSSFGLRTVGPAEDWPERLEFHQTRAGLGECGHGNRMPPLSTLRIAIISDRLATPCSPPIEQLDFSVLTPNWSHYGRKITDVLSCLQLETDYFDDEEMEPDLLNAEENNVTDFSIPPENLICLWPLVMLTSVRSHKIQTNLSTRSAARFLLTMLTRPSLLTFLSSIQSCTRPVPAQQRAFRSSSVQTPDDQSIAEFCAQTSVAGEWRSLSHAVHALTWPMLSHYGLDARQDRQTLIGWYDRQNALRKAYQLLLMFPFSSPATGIPLLGSSYINGKDVREQSGEIWLQCSYTHYVQLRNVQYTKTNDNCRLGTVLQRNNPMRPFISANSAKIQQVDATWIAHEFSPHLTLARHTLSKWPEWESVLHLAECLAHYVMLLHTDTQNVQLQAISGVVFGCLYLRCVSPYSPMDPYLVHKLEEEAVSNEYAQLRRRLLAFVCGFADQFLLPGDETTNVSSVLSHLSLCNIQRWIEVVADLVEWLTQPERINSFADVINPFLVGLLHIHHGLQKLTHLTLSTGSLELEMTQTALELLTTGLLGGRSTVQRKIAYACSSVPLWLAVQFTQPELRAAIYHLEEPVSGACVADSITARETVTAQTEFRLMSWILDLIWLHLNECRSAPPEVSTETVERFVGRLLAFVTRPLARRWRLVEAERKRAAAERASLFIEAASRKQRVCDQLQHFSLPGKQSRRSDTTDTMDDLIDPDAVQNIEAVDTWLRQSLERTTHTWIPENNELAYFVQRLIGLLLARRNWCRAHSTSLVQSISEHSQEWRWHSLLGGYSLASSLLFKSGLSLDPSIDHIGLPVHLCVSAHLTQTDVRSRQPIPLESSLDPAYSWTPKPRVFDVYRDPIPAEACGQLRAVLSHLETRVRQLLHTWPGQPSLVRLLVLSQRIKGFQVSDPLMKFITGLEMVWEEIHPSIPPSAAGVDEPGQVTARCRALIELMENGPLGEFVTRWRLLCARPCIRPSLYGLDYQSKGVVSVTKWGDYTRFWSVKTSVERCKRTIHKQVKAWEAILRRPVRPLFESAVRITTPIMPLDLADYRAHFNPTELRSSGHIPPSVLSWLIALCQQQHSTLPTHVNSPNSDSSNDSSDTDLDSEIDMHADELSVKNQDEENTNQLPQLGLSYRRGQLHSQTGSMTVYLGQFAGSPWNHTYSCGDDVEKQYIGHEDSRDWIRQTAKRVCDRTARLLALRASLPRIPGQPDASPETVASIVTDLGGPENLARLIGFADDLVNQTATALAACSELTSTVREFRDQTRFSLSLSPFGQDVSNQEFRACAQTALRRAQKSAFVLIQLTQDVLLQLTMFWTTCANQHCTDWPPVSQLEHVTGAELWKSVYSPLLDQYPLEPIGLLAERMRNSCEALNTLANSVLVRAMAIIQTGSLLIPPGWTCLQNDLVEATLYFVQHLRNSVTLCEQAGFYCEMNETVNTICVRLCDEVERLKTSCESSTVAIDGDWTDSGPVDEAFVSLSNALIRAILSTVEVLYKADRPTTSEATQVDYLLQFTRAATDTKRLVQTQLSRLFVRWNTSFQPEVANGSEVDNKLSVRLRLARCILPFLDQLNHCVQIRAAQFWHWLDNWTCLGEAMLRITGQLLTDGFCRPAGLTQSEGSGEDGDAGGSGGGGTDNQSSSSTLPDGSQTGATSLTAQGVDTHGAQDVSDQIELEEQIEGLMHDHDLEQPPDESDDEDRGKYQNQGIEMPDDNFAGRLEDAATESDADDQGEETKEQLENRMHNGNDLSGGAEELSKEMWASEDEEEIDGKDQIGQDKTLLADETGGVEDKANRTDGSKSELIDDEQVQRKPKEHPESEEENLTNEVCEPEDKKPNDTKRSKPMKQAEGKDRQTVAGTDANADEETPNALNDNQLEPTDPEGDKKDEQLRAEAEMMHMDEQQETSDSDNAELSDLSGNAMDVDDPEQVDEESEVGNHELDARRNEDVADGMINPNGSEDTTGLNSDTALVLVQLFFVRSVEEEQEAGQTESTDLEVFPYQPGAGDLQDKYERKANVLESGTDIHEISSDLAQSDMYQHLPDHRPDDASDENRESQPHAYDSATAEQRNQNQTEASNTEEESMEPGKENDGEENMELGHESEQQEGETDRVHSEPINESQSQIRPLCNPHRPELPGSEIPVKTDPTTEPILTLGAQRPPDSVICTKMTFDALATVVTALNLLEVGRIGVCSFGETVRILHDLNETWVGDAGPNVLARFTFKQSRTSLVQLLHSSVKLMQSYMNPVSSSSLPSQLLLILSDGVFSEDPQDPAVQAAVRLARDSRLFPVCLILDDMRKKHSVFDLRRYTNTGKIVPYMDTFPLPFYLVLRDVTALPQLLADALRQWFELESTMS
ncbi:Midasin [Fasciola gigantica]|uniref:Midasin n=1 Tax=Fasciola gigantica TaxID=46835 RepID=A0A504YEV8_FASGI|nr:Midasin [Fasciola gigantica]